MEDVDLAGIEYISRSELTESRLDTLENGHDSFDDVLNSRSDPITLDGSGGTPYDVIDGRHHIYLAREEVLFKSSGPIRVTTLSPGAFRRYCAFMKPAVTKSERGIPSLLRWVLLEVRFLCRQGYSAQAGRLADAAHTLPVNWADGTLDVSRLPAEFEEYEAAYRGKPSGDPSGRPPLRNYPEDLRSIIKNLGDN